MHKNAGLQPSPAHERLTDLLDYVGHLARLNDKVVHQLASYGQPVFHEAGLRGLPGVRLGGQDENGAVWLAIERLQRAEPPPPPPEIAPWLVVAKDPARAPKAVELRVVQATNEEAAMLVAKGAADWDDVLPAKKPLPGRALSECHDVTLRLSKQPALRRAIAAYVDDRWRGWAEAERPRRAAIAAYETLFALQQTIRGDKAERPLQLVWGIGFAQWRRDGQVLDHPLIEQPVEIDLDRRSALLVRPRDAEPVVHLKPFEEMEAEGVTALRRRIEALQDDEALPDLSPYEPSSYGPVLRAAAQLLDPGARYAPDDAASDDDRALPEPTETLTVTDHWALYAKPRDENLIVRDLERLKGALRDAADLPASARGFVEEPSDERPGNGWRLGGGGRTGGMDTPPGGEFYFPKPFNKEQQEIIRRLERADGVVVQGPPGTGKTHSIANIICHYLAAGKRVLVTSKGEAALGVLRGHLPKDIRDLAIALLTTERDGLRQLERAVELLASTIAQKDEAHLRLAIERHERQIAALNERVEGIDAELGGFAERHLAPLQVGDGRFLLPEALARALVEDRDAHAWLPDRPGHEPAFEPGLTEAQLGQAREIRRRLGADLLQAGAVLPAPADLPDETDFLAVHRDLALAARIDEEAAAGGLPHLALREPNAVERVDRLVRNLQSYLHTCGFVHNTPWARQLEARLAGNLPNIAQERELLDRRCRELEALQARQSDLLEAAVLLPPGAEASAALLAAAERGAAGAKPFGFFDREARVLAKGVQVNGRAPDTAAAWGHVLGALTYKRDLGQMIQAWSALAVLGIPPLGPSPAQAAAYLGLMAQQLRAVLGLRQERAWFERELQALFPTGTGQGGGVLEPGGVRVLLERLQRVLARHRLEERRGRKAALVETLRQGRGDCVRVLATLVMDRWGKPEEDEDRLLDDYRSILAEMERLRRLVPAYRTLLDVAATVHAMGAPHWAQALLQEPVAGERDPWTPGHWRASWDWWRSYAKLEAIDGRERILRLAEQRAEAERRRRQLFQDLVRDRAFLGLKRAMSNRVLAALQKFIVAIKKVGKGTGKGAVIWRRAAREALDDASRAVPCWIMPHWRVSESLPPTIGDFDLVIVDEASQSDLSALPAILRGSKMLIVGDDKQVSPLATFIQVRRLEQLRETYLRDQFFGPLMLPGNSLYDLAGAVFPSQKLMLREHFRCVEPIIRFSMQFYSAPDGDQPLYPVRLPKPSERLDPPLVAIHVPHGRKARNQTNLAEAEVIVDEIERLVHDPAFEGRSIGVVSLLGGKQADLVQTLLLERLGDAPFEAHEIACGDSATFQGKERDIMFVSMVECPQTATAKTAAMFQQRYNVALSRARDRMVLVYSVDEGRLKADDLKAKVLRHFRNPMPNEPKDGSDPFSLCQSQFERKVLRHLLDRGYRAIPQVQIGAYAIDIVVEGDDDRRLAVELDGDHWHGPDRWQEDLARQRVLERCGWRFWRCWGSSYHLRPEACMADLEATLQRMGIEPTDTTWTPPRYTSFRTIEREPDEEEPLAVEAEIVEEPTLPVAAGMAVIEEPMLSHDLPPEPPLEDQVLAVGDRFVMAYMDNPDRHLSLTMTTDDHHPEVGLVSANHAIFRQFLGCGVEEQIEVMIDGRKREAVLLKIDKAPQVATRIAGKDTSLVPS